MRHAIPRRQRPRGAPGAMRSSSRWVLNLSIKTIETHRAAAMRKLGLNSTAALVRYVVRNNLAEP